jgi:adenine-specific DNA methylase
MLLVGTYYVPPIRREVEVGTWYEGKLKAILRGYAAMNRAMPHGQDSLGKDRPCQDWPRPLIVNGDARELAMPSDSVDYIFTDPPYADAVQYGELNFVWESWLGDSPAWHADEIVVNASRGKSEAEWAASMTRAMAECYRVLKPGRWLSLCYHDRSEGRWAMVQDLMVKVGFRIDTDQPPACIETGQRSFNQFMSDKATKRDLVVNFRKPRPGELGMDQTRATATDDVAAFELLGRQIIGEFLATNPGSTKDRVYDEFVGRMMRLGQMKAHSFDALLQSVADEVRPSDAGPGSPGRWYVKDR